MLSNAEALAGLGSKNDKGKQLHAGFVVFASLAACSSALQLIHSSDPTRMNVVEAPEPAKLSGRMLAKHCMPCKLEHSSLQLLQPHSQSFGSLQQR